MGVFCMVTIFFSLFEQYQSSWVQQGMMMERPGWSLPLFGDLTEETIQMFNPFLIMILVPVVIKLRARAEGRGWNVHAIRMMAAGMFIASASFVAIAFVQRRVDALALVDQKLNLLWQLLPYTIVTIAEVGVSAIGLEFAYTQAPPRMKSTVMGFLMLSISLGNLLVAVMAKIGPQKLEHSFWLFAGLMAAAAVIFAVIVRFYKVRDYTQGT